MHVTGSPIKLATARFFLDATVEAAASPAAPIAALCAVILTGFALVIATLWTSANRLRVATSPGNRLDYCGNAALYGK
jgi:hypothetical protein